MTIPPKSFEILWITIHKIRKLQATHVAKNITHATSWGEACDGGAWLARNATENMPIAIRNAAIGLIDPLSKLAVKMGVIGVISVFICKILVREDL